MHKTLLLFHRWVALTAGVVIFVVAASGSALVFEGAIDRALRPDLWRVAPAGTPLPLDTLVARVKADDPKASITGLTLSPVSDRAYVVAAGPTQVFVDPYTGAIRGKRTAAEFNTTLPRRLHVFHVSLMASKVGGAIVGIATTVALLLVLSGLFVWWRDKIWRIHWAASWKRVNFDLHHALGLFAALVLLVITMTGVTIHYGSINRLMYKLDSAPAPKVPEQPKADGARGEVSMDAIAHVAATALPGARLIFVSTPPKPDQPFAAAMRFPEDRTPGGRSRVYVDRFRGTVLLAVSTREAQAGTRLANSIRSLHTGDILGKPTEAIWLAAAIVMAGQAITGFLMWWNARAARSARRDPETQ